MRIQKSQKNSTRKTSHNLTTHPQPQAPLHLDQPCLIFPNPARIFFKKRPTYANYLHQLGPLHADEWQAYTDWKKYNLPKEVIGTIRNLLPEEL
jgi:hypothetical protein